MAGAPTLLLIAAFVTCALALVSLAGLSAWRGWLALRREEVAASARGADRVVSAAPSGAELAALKERLRRLEAIASGEAPPLPPLPPFPPRSPGDGPRRLC
jgi:hypothetical protein